MNAATFREIFDILTSSGIDYQTLVDIFVRFIETWEDSGCDDLHRFVGQDEAFDEAWDSLHGEQFDD